MYGVLIMCQSLCEGLSVCQVIYSSQQPPEAGIPIFITAEQSEAQRVLRKLPQTQTQSCLTPLTELFTYLLPNSEVRTSLLCLIVLQDVFYESRMIDLSPEGPGPQGKGCAGTMGRAPSLLRLQSWTVNGWG